MKGCPFHLVRSVQNCFQNTEREHCLSSSLSSFRSESRNFPDHRCLRCRAWSCSFSNGRQSWMTHCFCSQDPQWGTTELLHHRTGRSCNSLGNRTLLNVYFRPSFHSPNWAGLTQNSDDSILRLHTCFEMDHSLVRQDSSSQILCSPHQGQGELLCLHAVSPFFTRSDFFWTSTSWW